MLVKDKFHRFIDQIDDEKTLEAYLNLISNLNTRESGTLYSKLTSQQKEELEVSYQESFDAANLLSNDDVKSDFAEWL